MTVAWRARQSTDALDIPISSAEYDEPPITLTDLPRFALRVPNPNVMAELLIPGKNLDIYRAGEKVMPGIIETAIATDGDQGAFVTVRGLHRGYHFLRARICDSYDFDRNSNPFGSRDGVTVNPWGYMVLRNPDGAILAPTMKPAAIDGIRPDEVFESLLGTKAAFQVDFQDNSFLWEDDVNTATAAMHVYRNGAASDVRPALQRRRNGTAAGGVTPSYAAPANVNSIPLMSGDPNIDEMGQIDSVSVLIVGKREADQDPTLDVCRNAGSVPASRTYSAITLTKTDDYKVTGVTAWSGSHTFSGAESQKNRLAFRLNFDSGSAGDSVTTRIWYIKLVCTLSSPDTGLTKGTVTTYASPYTLADDSHNYVDKDFHGMRRHEAMEELRKITRSATATNPSPHWDMHVDADLTAHFVERRGSDVTNHDYAFDEGNLLSIEDERFGGQLVFQTVAHGSGSGTAQSRLVSKASDLYDSNRDPNGVDKLYGSLPMVGLAIDPNARTGTSLYQTGAAYHKLHRDPIQTVRARILAEGIRFFNPGDRIKVRATRTRTNGFLRVAALSRRIDPGDRESWNIRLGEDPEPVARYVANSDRKADIVATRIGPKDNPTPSTGDVVRFDKTRPGVFAFNIPDGPKVARVLLRLATRPLQIGRDISAETYVSILYSASTGVNTISSGSTATLSDLTEVAGGVTKTSQLQGVVFRAKLVARSDTDWEIRLILVDQGGTDRVFDTIYLGTLGRGGTVDGTYDVSHYIPAVRLYANNTITDLTGARLEIINRDGSSQDIQSALLEVLEVRKGPLGNFQFDGDEGDGTADPIYAKDIEISVDPTLTTPPGTPTTANFDTKRHPQKFGRRDRQDEIDLDITNYLKATSGGETESGVHRVWFRGTEDTTSPTNTNGVGEISVTPILIMREGA